MKINLMVFTSNDKFAKEYSEESIWEAFKIAIPKVLTNKKLTYSFQVYSKPSVCQVLIPGSISRNTTQYNKKEGFYIWFFGQDLAKTAKGLDSPILSPKKSPEQNAKIIESWLNHCIYEWFGDHLLK